MQSKARLLSPLAPAPTLLQDHFDQLPDALVLTILNKVADVHSLGRCSAVSKRFRSLVPLVHDLHLKIDGTIITTDEGKPPTSHPGFSRLRKLILSAVTKPFLSHRITNRHPNPRYSPTVVLKNFPNVRHLTVELPPTIPEDGVFLKWREEVGSTRYFLAGTQVPAAAQPDEGGFTANEVIHSVQCIVNCLETASRRHFFVWPMVRDLPTLRSFVLTYADGQGKQIMEWDHLREFRETPPEVLSKHGLRESGERLLDALSNGEQVPTRRVEVRYARYLDIGGGIGLKGATLLTMSTLAEEVSIKRVVKAFDGPSRAAVVALMKQTAYAQYEL